MRLSKIESLHERSGKAFCSAEIVRFTAPAVANAVHHATGGRFTALTLTPERVFKELEG